MNSLDRSFKLDLDKQDEKFIGSFMSITRDVIGDSKRYKPKDVLDLDSHMNELQTGYGKKLSRLFQMHGRTCLELGRKHGKFDIIAAGKEIQVKKLATPLPPDMGIAFWLYPETALNAISERQLILSGDVSSDMIRSVKDILREKLFGAAEAEVEAQISKILKASQERSELISITESTYYYNRGRLATYLEDDVSYVQFSAIMDSRTSEQCSSRHGLIMKVDSPEMEDNIPPLHGRCRSILKPYFGVLDEKLMDWSGAAPLPSGWRTAA